MLVCGKCRRPLTESSPAGLCAACLLQDGFGWEEEEAGQTSSEQAAAATGAPAPSSFPEGEARRCLGDYELLEEIGRGGMGVVYKARQKSLDRLVAVKTLHLGPQANPDFIKRFRAEAVAAASLHHPNIVAIHEVGVQEGQHFFAMDFVEGQSLARLVGNQPLPGPHAARYLKAIAEAIDFAHERGILHRDLKPSNVLIDLNDQPRVTDFGLAKRLEGNSELTLTGQVLGSPNYIPPEQAAGTRQRVSRRSDVYGLGAILYHLLTGRPPFQAETLTSTLHQVLHEETISPRLLNPGVPRDLETICLKCLEKEPSRRYESARLMAEELDRYLRQEPIHARPAGRIEKVWRWCRRQPVRAGLIAALAVAIVSGAIGVFWQWRQAEAQRRRAQAGELSAWQHAYVADMNLAQAALEMNNRGRALELLRKHQPTSKTEIRDPKSEIPALQPAMDLRHWEWRYLWKRCESDALRTLAQYPMLIQALAVSADEGLLAIRTDPHIIIWDLIRQTERYRIPWGRETCALAFSPVEDLLAYDDSESPGNCSVILYDVQARQIVGRLPHPTHALRRLAFSPDGKILATMDPGEGLRFWNVASQELMRSFLRDPYDKTDYKGVIQFSSEGRRLAVGGRDGRLRLLEWATGMERQLSGPVSGTGILSLAFSPDGKILAAGYGYREKPITLWDGVTGQALGELEGSAGSVFDLAFNRSRKLLASATADQSIRLWDVETRTEIRRLLGHTDEVHHLKFLRDGKTLISGGRDGAVCLWSAEPRTEGYTDATLPYGMRQLAFPPDSRQFVTTSRSGAVEMWDTATLRKLSRLSELGTNNGAVAISPNGQFLVVGDGTGTNKVWDLASHRLVAAVGAHAAVIEYLFFLNQGRTLVSVDCALEFKSWDTASWQETPLGKLGSHPFDLPPLRVVYVPRFSPDGHLLVVNTNRDIIVTDVATGEQRVVPTGHRQPISGLTFSPDGRWLVSAGDEGLAKIWEVGTWRCLVTLKGHRAGCHSSAFSPDGRRLMTCSGMRDTAILWDLETFQPVVTLPGTASLYAYSGFSPDGSTLFAIAWDGSGTTHLWRAPSLSEIEEASLARPAKADAKDRAAPGEAETF